jgi:hypothetical protein
MTNYGVRVPAIQAEIANGLAVAEVLSGAWRRVPLQPQFPAPTLVRIRHLLTEYGQAGLAWWRVRNSALRSTPAARRFRQDYRALTLDAAAKERHIERVVSRLRAEGVETILIKGWGCSRVYAEPGLRPYGDIDLCVPPQHFAIATAVFTDHSAESASVDLHRGLPDLPDRTWNEVFARTRLVCLGDTDVRILGPEDHLRLICLHLIRHGAFRPLWLCDVAAALEQESAAFDWEYCLSGNKTLSAWVRCAISLARTLVRAKLETPKIAHKIGIPPEWVKHTVLWRWGAGRHRSSARYYFRHPAQALRGLHHHGLNPIKHAYALRVRPYPRLPLLLVQLGGFAVGDFPVRLRRMLTKGRSDSSQPFAVHR